MWRARNTRRASSEREIERRRGRRQREGGAKGGLLLTSCAQQLEQTCSPRCQLTHASRHACPTALSGAEGRSDPPPCPCSSSSWLDASTLRSAAARLTELFVSHSDTSSYVSLAAICSVPLLLVLLVIQLQWTLRTASASPNHTRPSLLRRECSGQQWMRLVAAAVLIVVGLLLFAQPVLASCAKCCSTNGESNQRTAARSQTHNDAIELILPCLNLFPLCSFSCSLLRCCLSGGTRHLLCRG